MARLSVSTPRRDGAALLRDGLLDQDAEAGGGEGGDGHIVRIIISCRGLSALWHNEWN